MGRSRSRSRDRSRSPAPRGGGDGHKVPHSNDLFSVMLNDIPVSGSHAVRGVEDLKPLFEKFGKIGDVFLPSNRGTGELRGFGFIRFYEERDRDDCLEHYRKDRLMIGDHEVRIDEAKARPRPGGRDWDPAKRRFDRDGRPNPEFGRRDRYRDDDRRDDYRRDDRRDDYRRDDRRDDYRSRDRSRSRDRYDDRRERDRYERRSRDRYERRSRSRDRYRR